jgi:hypothetical protein
MCSYDVAVLVANIDRSSGVMVGVGIGVDLADDGPGACAGSTVVRSTGGGVHPVDGDATGGCAGCDVVGVDPNGFAGADPGVAK